MAIIETVYIASCLSVIIAVAGIIDLLLKHDTVDASFQGRTDQSRFSLEEPKAFCYLGRWCGSKSSNGTRQRESHSSLTASRLILSCLYSRNTSASSGESRGSLWYGSWLVRSVVEDIGDESAMSMTLTRNPDQKP